MSSIQDELMDGDSNIETCHWEECGEEPTFFYLLGSPKHLHAKCAIHRFRSDMYRPHEISRAEAVVWAIMHS